jgi:hypothetical protein
MQTAAEEIADECVRKTGTRRLGRNARQVALVAIMLSPDGKVDLKEYREQIRAECHRRKEFGSFFLIFVLPLIVNLVSAWIAQWLINRHRDFPLRRLRTEAFDAL